MLQISLDSTRLFVRVIKEAMVVFLCLPSEVDGDLIAERVCKGLKVGCI